MASAEPRHTQSSMASIAPAEASFVDAPLVGGGLVGGALAGGTIEGPKGWKRRLEDPFNTYYRYPVALGITRLLVRTPITPNQVSLVQPLIAAAAGWLVTFPTLEHHVGAVALFELRSILDCVDGSLARAKKLSSPNGHAIDAMADWLGVVLLHVGIFVHLYRYGVPGWSTAAVLGVASVALFQGAARSFASDYFKTKFLGIYEKSSDECVETLRKKEAEAASDPSLFGRIDRFILRMGHLSFEGERFDLARSRPLSSAAIARMQREQDAPGARAVAFAWSISNGDAFLTFVMLSLLTGSLWAGQLFFATAGLVWIAVVMRASVLFVRSYKGD